MVAFFLTEFIFILTTGVSAYCTGAIFFYNNNQTQCYEQQQ